LDSLTMVYQGVDPFEFVLLGFFEVLGCA